MKSILVVHGGEKEIDDVIQKELIKWGNVFGTRVIGLYIEEETKDKLVVENYGFDSIYRIKRGKGQMETIKLVLKVLLVNNCFNLLWKEIEGDKEIVEYLKTQAIKLTHSSSLLKDLKKKKEIVSSYYNPLVRTNVMKSIVVVNAGNPKEDAIVQKRMITFGNLSQTRVIGLYISEEGEKKKTKVVENVNFDSIYRIPKGKDQLETCQSVRNVLLVNNCFNLLWVAIENHQDAVKYFVEEKINVLHSNSLFQKEEKEEKQEKKEEKKEKKEEKKKQMITVTDIGDKVKGLSVKWKDGQFVVIVCPQGLVACGAINEKCLEKFGFAVTVSEGTKDSPLVTPEDLLKAKVMTLTKKAKELGIKVGMTGKEAMEKLK